MEEERVVAGMVSWIRLQHANAMKWIHPGVWRHEDCRNSSLILIDVVE